MKAPQRERILWIAVTVVLLSAVAFFGLSPRLLAGTNEDETTAYFSVLREALQVIQANYVDADKTQTKRLIEGALKGMFDSLEDPYSAYLSADDMRDMDDTVTGRFSGIGAIITKVDKGAEIVSPIEGSPAFREGLSAGDIILKVDDTAVADMRLTDITNRIKGEAKTPVKLSILRGDAVQFDVTIVRDVVEVPTVKRAMLPGAVGYLRIIQFTPLTYDKCREAVQFFKQNAYTALVIDVRNNPGGLLDSVVKISNLFVGEGVIVSTRSDRLPSENRTYYASRSRLAVEPSVPIAVLTDRGSASAAEILSGVLKDTKRGTLVGEKTYGKGSVQQIMGLGGWGAGMRLTMSRYYTPSNVSIDKIGIEPAIKVEEPKLSRKEEEDLTELLTTSVLKDFVKANPKPTEAQVGALIDSLHGKGMQLNDRYLKRLVRNEVNRTNNDPPVFDLEYDLVLQTALEAIRDGRIKGQ